MEIGHTRSNQLEWKENLSFCGIYDLILVNWYCLLVVCCSCFTIVGVFIFPTLPRQVGLLRDFNVTSIAIFFFISVSCDINIKGRGEGGGGINLYF